MSVIFLAGVHGVGKGFLGAPVAKDFGVSHFTASQLDVPPVLSSA